MAVMYSCHGQEVDGELRAQLNSTEEDESEISVIHEFFTKKNCFLFQINDLCRTIREAEKYQDKAGELDGPKLNLSYSTFTILYACKRGRTAKFRKDKENSMFIHALLRFLQETPYPYPECLNHLSDWI